MKMSPVLAEMVMGDEVVTRSWKISLRTFLLRNAIFAGVTFGLVFIPLIIAGAGFFVAFGVAFNLTIISTFLFSDGDLWLRNRKTVWHLSNKALYIEDPQADAARIPLADILEVKHPAGEIFLLLNSRDRVTLPLPPRPAELVLEIKAAIAQSQSLSPHAAPEQK